MKLEVRRRRVKKTRWRQCGLNFVSQACEIYMGSSGEGMALGLKSRKNHLGVSTES